jgi:hypothetical protein
MMGEPMNGRMFLPFTRVLPPRAGMTARSMMA